MSDLIPGDVTAWAMAWKSWNTRLELQADRIATLEAENARLREDAKRGSEWQDLFWRVALELDCLPSVYVDANDHVLTRAAWLTDPSTDKLPWSEYAAHDRQKRRAALTSQQGEAG